MTDLTKWATSKVAAVDNGQRRKPKGFSLLEVMVAMTLATVLLGAVWTLFQILTKRQTIEIEHAETNQMLRSLHQRLTRDLNNLPAIDRRAAVPLPPVFDAESMPGGRLPWPYNVLDAAPSAAAPATVLRGNRTSLSLLQFLEPMEWNSLDDQDEEPTTGQQSNQRAPLVKQVVYHLPDWPMADDSSDDEGFASDSEDSEDSESEGRRDLSELVREELGMNQTVSLDPSPNGMESRQEDYFSNGDRDRNQAPESSPMMGAEPDVTDESEPMARRESLNDIAVATFAYFDGRRWRNEWDTDLEKRLPIAIRFRWRQSAVPTANEGDSSSPFSDMAPPDEFVSIEPEPDRETDLGNAFGNDANSELESPEARWYEGEWIFLLQPNLNPEGPLTFEKNAAIRYRDPASSASTSRTTWLPGGTRG